MTAHQRLIRERLSAEQPRAAAASLDGYKVEFIGRGTAQAIILQYEWLRTLGHAWIFVGLVAPAGAVHGVAAFGHGPGGPIGRIIGTPALCLERGACVHYAPKNAASYLITRACKLVHDTTGVARFFAYCDPLAGEYGGVYQAANWVYLGQGLVGGRQRPKRWRVLPPGADPDDLTAWQTSRVFRRKGLTEASAKAAGWIVDKQKPAKHVYATHVGGPAERRAWRQSLHARASLLAPKSPWPLAYPAPDPALKGV